MCSVPSVCGLLDDGGSSSESLIISFMVVSSLTTFSSLSRKLLDDHNVPCVYYVYCDSNYAFTILCLVCKVTCVAESVVLAILTRDLVHFFKISLRVGIGALEFVHCR